MVLQEVWDFQREIPVRESHYSLQLPPGWAYKALWFNYPETKPTENGSQLQWTISDVKGIREEAEDAAIGRSLRANGGSHSFRRAALPFAASATGRDGTWYLNLTSGRRDASPEIKQEVSTLTASSKTQLENMQALAQVLQHDIRYVAISLSALVDSSPTLRLRSSRIATAIAKTRRHCSVPCWVRSAWTRITWSSIQSADP